MEYEKKVYQPPTLTVYGEVATLTQSGGPPKHIDVPIGTPIDIGDLNSIGS
jgi:hypothetical protein